MPDVGRTGSLRVDFEYLTYLAYPLLSLSPYGESSGIVSHSLALELTGTVLFEFRLSAVAMTVWLWLQFHYERPPTERAPILCESSPSTARLGHSLSVSHTHRIVGSVVSVGYSTVTGLSR